MNFKTEFVQLSSHNEVVPSKIIERKENHDVIDKD